MTETETTLGRYARRALHGLARASAPRPVAAERAARDFGKPTVPAVWAEIRWAFHPPRTWLSGVVANLLLAAAWLLVQPLTAGYDHHPTRHHHHQQLDWVVLVSTYFSSFILADVTTTNLLGGDHVRVAKGLRDGVPLWRILVVKNLALVAIVGLPTFAAAAALTRSGSAQAALL